jgi:hypothetical protein
MLATIPAMMPAMMPPTMPSPPRQQQIGVLEPIASPFWSALELHPSAPGLKAQDTELAAISQRPSRRFYDRLADHRPRELGFCIRV